MIKFSFYSNKNFALDTIEMLKSLGYNLITSYEAGQANQTLYILIL